MKILVVIILGSLSLGIVQADQMLIGTWETGKGERMDVLDGFKPNMGPVIRYSDGEVEGVYTWRIDTTSKELKMRYSSTVYALSDNGLNLLWNNKKWSKSKELETQGIVNLATDANSFIDGLTGHSWSGNSSSVGKMEFTRTFSNTEGVVTRFDQDQSLKSLDSWGIASGVLKIGSQVYLEIRITPQYLIGVDDDDDEFLVLNKGESRGEISQTSMLESREQFLAAMTTGAWRRPGGYRPDYIYRFRPIEGDLKGRVFQEGNNRLESTSVWEFSPATGAMKIGYTEYNGGITIDNLLVLVKKDGDQKSYLRDLTVEEKSFNIGDVKTIEISERTASKVMTATARQLSYEDQYTLFEFSEDGRTGYVHEWKSYPFQITGQSLKAEGWGSYEQIYLIEDYIVFGEGRGRKIDLRQSRLRPKSDAEAESDAKQSEQALAELQKGKVSLKIVRTDGSQETISLPIADLGELKSIEVVSE